MMVFSWPRDVVFGCNASHEVGRYAAKDNKHRAMIITDQEIRRLMISIFFFLWVSKTTQNWLASLPHPAVVGTT